MITLLKLLGILLISVTFVISACLFFLDNLFIQMLLVLMVILVSILRFSWKKVFSEIRLLLPYLSLMFLIYFLLGVINLNLGVVIKNGQSVFTFWLCYGLNRLMLFVSSVLFFQLILSFVNLEDILKLPLSLSKKKVVILGKALFLMAVRYLDELEFHLKLLPEYQISKLSLRQWFRFKLQLTLALIIMLLREAKIKGELIDNRIKHCYFELQKRS